MSRNPKPPGSTPPVPKTSAPKPPVSKHKAGGQASKSTQSDRSASNSPALEIDSRGTDQSSTAQGQSQSFSPSKWPGPKGWPEVWKSVHDDVLLRYYLRKDKKRYNLDYEDIHDMKGELTFDMKAADFLQGTFDVGFLFERLEHALVAKGLPAGEMYLHWPVVLPEWRITVCLACHDSGRKNSVAYVNLDSNRACCAYCGAMPYFLTPKHRSCKLS